MIVHRDGRGGGWIVAQTDHAHPCGEICARLHESFVDAEIRDELRALCARHDDGWLDWERAPRTVADGAPVDFRDMDEEEHAAIWRAGIDVALREIGPFAAAVLARHAKVLAPPESPRFGEYARRVVECSRAAFPGDDPAVREWRLERAYFVLRLCDLATLNPCAGWTEPMESPLLDVDGHHCDVVIAVPRPWTVEIAPWPFAGEGFGVHLDLVPVQGGDWAAGLAEMVRGERRRRMLDIRPGSR